VLTAPRAGQTLGGGTLHVAYSALGDLNGVGHAVFAIDGHPVSEDTRLDGSHRITGIRTGPHTLTAWLATPDHAKIAGSDAAPVSFVVVVDPSDAHPPRVALRLPPGSRTLSGSVRLEADASDDVGVYGVQFRLDGADLGGEALSAPYAVTFDTTLAADGSHTLTAVARDAAGNETVSPVETVTLSNPDATDPSVVGQWAGPFSWPLVSIHATLLPAGNVLLWDDHTTTAGVQIWDPVADTLTSDPYTANNLFCAGHSMLPDGRVIVLGGHIDAYVGIPDVTLFTPSTMAWAAGPSMAQARWYPTGIALGNGKTLVVSGASNCPSCSDPNGSHVGINVVPEIYDPNANTWTELTAASISLPLYPHLHLLPDGRVLFTGSQEDPIVSRVLDLNTQTWSVIDSTYQDAGSSVMYRPGKILKTGTARNPDYPAVNAAATAYVLDMNQPAPAWRAVAPMSAGRTQHNLTMLPDGNVLLSGGATSSDVYNTASAVEPAALWSPATETWTPLASLSDPRLYHSTVLLLPDGRVLAAGGGRYGPDYPSAEIFSPPYLFKGARPTITSAPSTLGYGSHFAVGTPDGASIATVSLLRLGSVTHAFNANQRYVQLWFTQSAGGLDVVAPASANLVPPGYYMLFLVNGNGVPSIAAILRFPAPWEDSSAPTAPSGLTAFPSLGRVDLTWSAAADNTGVTGYNVHRGTVSGFTPTTGNRVGQTAGTSFSDLGFASGTYYYVVTAQDVAGNIGPKSNEVSASVTADTTPPSVTVTAPPSGATLSGVVGLTAVAADDVGVAGVQFLLDGAALGAEDLAPPYTLEWNTGLAANGAHTLSARARDARGNVTTATGVPVTVSNSVPQGLVLAYAFNEGAGSTARDSSGSSNRGTITGATWTPSGHTGGALSFDGTQDFVLTRNSQTLDIGGTGLTVEMWANITHGNLYDYVLIAKPWTMGTGGAPYQYGLEFDANNLQTLDFYFSDPSGGSHGPYQMTPPLSTWTHIAYTYDGATVKGYLGGVLKVSSSISSSIQPRGTDLLIGVDGAIHQGYGGLLDDVRIYNRALTQAQIQADMGTAVPTPVPPVPDGSFGSPMTAGRGAADGSVISLAWDVASCAGKGYHTIYGPLSGVSTYQISGGVCGMGTSGSYSWTGVPAGDLWFVVVADDPSGVEGSWGRQSTGLPMNGATPSLVCGVTGRFNLSSCP